MEIKRDKYEELRRWAVSERRKPLILKGARQVGKTYLVRRFASQWPQFLNFNLEIPTDREHFEAGLTIHELVSVLFAARDFPKEFSRSLLFIDEIQHVPAAVQMLRYFYEEYPELAVITAGSLLTTLTYTPFAFPVGRVTTMDLRPVSFQEYLSHKNTVLAEAYHTIPCPRHMHHLLLSEFHRYAMIGGMPEAVTTYLENEDIVSVHEVYRDLLSTFLDDAERYAISPGQREILRHVIRASLTEASQRITFQNFGGSNYRSREVKEVFGLLENAQLVHLLYPTGDTSLPVQPNKRKAPYLYWMDTGIVNHASGWQTALIGVTDLNEKYRGRIAQHITAQELRIAADRMYQPLYFWTREKRNAQSEVDFVIAHEGNLIPIEVKSGKSGQLRSLHQFIDAAPHDMAIRLFAGQLQLQNAQTISGNPFRLLNLPYYLAGIADEYCTWMSHG